MSQFCRFGLGETEVNPLYSALQAREVVHSLCSYSLGKGNLSEGSLLALSNAGLGSRIMQAK